MPKGLFMIPTIICTIQCIVTYFYNSLLRVALVHSLGARGDGGSRPMSAGSGSGVLPTLTCVQSTLTSV